MFMIDLGAPSYYSILGVSPDADVREIRESQTKIYRELERQRLKARSPEEKRNLTERQQNINKIGDGLSNLRTRSQYDKDNVHLTFFLVRKAAAPVWGERGLLLRWMHQTVLDFLLEQGEALDPISDLERTDFTADYTANELLESLLRNHHETEGKIE